MLNEGQSVKITVTIIQFASVHFDLTEDFFESIFLNGIKKIENVVIDCDMSSD